MYDPFLHKHIIFFDNLGYQGSSLTNSKRPWLIDRETTPVAQKRFPGIELKTVRLPIQSQIRPYRWATPWVSFTSTFIKTHQN